MMEYVRVKTPAGHYVSYPKVLAEADPDLTILKQDAIDADGKPLPPKYHAKMNTPAPAKPGPKKEKE